MRLFIAVDIDSDEVKMIASDIQEYLKSTGVRATYPRLDDLHITLKFLGDVDESLLNEIVRRLSIKKFGKIRLSVDGVDGFPNLSRPRVIFLSVDDIEGKLKVLQEYVESQLAGLFPRESRPFKPHITIARIKQFYRLDERSISQLKSMVNKAMLSITSFKLKESILTQSGPIYKDISIFELE